MINFNNIDIELRDIIRQLNEKGYKTEACCQGHTERVGNNRVCIYITFDKEYNFKTEPIRIERKGYKMYGGLKQPTKCSSHKGSSIYYFTNKNKSAKEKEEERIYIINQLKDWIEKI